MTPAQYHIHAARTRMVLTRMSALTYCALKLSGESGEVHQTAMDGGTVAHRIHEIGDCCWYVAWIADLLGVDPLTLWTNHDQPAVFTFRSASERLSQATHAVCEATGKLEHGRPESTIIPPLRDVVAALYACARNTGTTMEEVWAANIDKLRARHPDGFTTDY